MNMMTWLQNAAAWAWHTSLVMAVPGLILLALGRWRGFSARWRMLLAGVMFLRLLMPTVPEVPWHPAMSLERALPSGTVPAADPELLMNRGPINPQNSASIKPAPVGVQSRIVEASSISWQVIAARIWALGVLGVAGWLVGSQWVLRRWIMQQAGRPDAELTRLFLSCCERMGLERRVGFASAPRMTTAAVWGWLRPVVLVPANLKNTHTVDEIRGVLLHELAHVKRCDVLWSWFGLAACALHWFNPLAWLALRRFHADRELDCDRMALGNLTAPQRNAYAPALLKTLAGASFATPAALVPFFRNKHEIHTRILTIMKPSKSLAARLAALAMIPALSFLVLTTASADQEKKTGATEETPAKLRDGEVIQKGPRDGEIKKQGPRDGETKKEGVRDGETKKEAARDGEVKKAPRDGEIKKEGARDGEVKKQGARDGDDTKKVVREGERLKKTMEAGKNGKSLVLRVVGNGERVLVDGQMVAANALRGYLSEQVDGGVTIVVEAEDNVPYRAVLDVLDAARDSGARGAKLSMGEGSRDGTKTKVVEKR